MDKTFLRIFVLVFGLVGLGLLAGAFFALKSELSFRGGAVSATGTVVDLVPTTDSDGNTLYKPLFEFTDRSDRMHRVTGSVASSPPSYQRGDKVTVRYSPDRPENARLDSFMDSWFLVVILGGLGIVFSSIAAGFVTYAVRKSRLRAWLAASGTRVQAKVDSVYHDTSMTVNGRSPFRITAQWQNPADRKIYVFRSDPIWFDPGPFMQRENVDVKINADDPRQYQMDTSFLPEAG